MGNVSCEQAPVKIYM